MTDATETKQGSIFIKLWPVYIIAAGLALAVSQGWHQYLTLESLSENADWLDELVAYLDSNRRMFDERINALPGLRSIPLEATYLAWVDFSGTGMSPEEITRRIQTDARIAANHGPTFGPGGETFLRSTFEYRVPLYTQSVPGTSRRRELFRGSLFLDTVTLDPNAYELDLDQTRVSAGIALGLIDPIPVTFSFGWPLREGNGDERQVFNFSLSLR